MALLSLVADGVVRARLVCTRMGYQCTVQLFVDSRYSVADA